MDDWKKVVSLSDCTFEDWDTERECPTCPVCKKDYCDCECPGPHQEYIFEYKLIRGVLHARKIKING